MLCYNAYMRYEMQIKTATGKKVFIGEKMKSLAKEAIEMLAQESYSDYNASIKMLKNNRFFFRIGTVECSLNKID